MNNRPTTTYTIRLRPIDQYFFGGETHHELDSRRQYFHRSNPYPQQTSLLGMLRHQLLIQQNLIPLNKSNQDVAVKLIGDTGFDGQRTDYGMIAALSPLRWLNDGKIYDLRRFDWLNTEDGIKMPTVNWQKKATSVKGVTPDIPVLEYQEKNGKTGLLETKPWIAKVHFTERLVHGTNDLVALDDVVSDKEQVGIWKDREGKAKEEGYFKFVYQRLMPDWSFVLQVSFYTDVTIAKVDKAIAFDTTKRIITMGAERSAFELEVLDVTPVEPAGVAAANGALQKITLLSDAFVADEAAFYKLANLPLCEATPFRYIKSKVTAEDFNYSGLPDRSERLHLLKRGSVFYTQHAEALTTLLKEQTAFYNIGYNHFLIENP